MNPAAMKTKIQGYTHSGILANIRKSPWFMKMSIAEKCNFTAAGTVNFLAYNNYTGA